ncbi:hypothetical protein M433DRAFT_152902 [Acidomyces richmondensis BFW]|nr:MAG: hypothetical protein FE78DRAFT_88440 [Acidomyces sp. 'richmondensis']KYG46870.1 hypothetical protein M433DRAFT_152902 [Acidomyces richmondensis BFW]
MLFPHLSSLLAFTTIVSAVPLEQAGKRSPGIRSWWTPSITTSYLEFGKRFPQANSNAPICDLASAAMPTAPTPLSAPAPGLSLYHVAIGRGTQNYTCDPSNATATPVAIGALATLYNVTCVAADSPDLLAELPGIALGLADPTITDDNMESPTYEYMTGHQYFIDPTTPYFNMDTDLYQYGSGPFKKLNSSDAPADAIKGQNNQGNGAVAWLKLGARDPDGQIFQEVYRVNTAGGNPPDTCMGMAASFEVQYSAEYWFYA